MDQLNIKVEIADRFFRLKINKDDEEFVRKAAELINEKVKAYSKNYAFKDKQDLLSMVALENTTEMLNKGNIDSKQEQIIKDKLLNLNNILEKAL
jgi:cell division protein ZapA